MCARFPSDLSSGLSVRVGRRHEDGVLVPVAVFRLVSGLDGGHEDGVLVPDADTVA